MMMMMMMMIAMSGQGEYWMNYMKSGGLFFMDHPVGL